MSKENINIYPKGIRFHSEETCRTIGKCPFHNPSDHKMVGWDINIRETALTERLCPTHRVGHPDPDSVPFMHELFCAFYPLEDGEEHDLDNCHWWIHGCCGCCFK